MSEFEFEDDLSGDYNDYEGLRDSDEDTEDASETDMLKYDDNEYIEIKEQMYRQKLAILKDQLSQLENNIHPDYLVRIKCLEDAYQERILWSEVFLELETERIEREYKNEKKSSVREFEERKIELKENLITELEDKKKMIETERVSLELANDSTEPKAIITRKLRRRPNEPLPIPEKRRRASPAQLNLLLDDNDITEDLKIICRALNAKPSSTGVKKVYACQIELESSMPAVLDARIEDGKLFYDKKWFHRGQNVLIEANDHKYSAILVQIGNAEIWVRKPNESIKSKISLVDLNLGKYSLYRRSS